MHPLNCKRSMLSLFCKSLFLLVLLGFLAGGGGCKGEGSCVDDEGCELGTHCNLADGLCVTLCKEDRDCKEGEECHANRGRCKSTGGVCKPKSSKKCVGSSLFWFDNCGYQGEVAEECGVGGCVDGSCKESDSCGNGNCDPGIEDCLSCPLDCKCEKEETCDNGTCKVADTCGNGTCEKGKEDCKSCAKDCKCESGEACDGGQCKSQKSCGNGKCESSENETCQTCVLDCPCKGGTVCGPNAACVEACGDGSCDNRGGENCANCEKDCACKGGLRCSQGRCERPCGNGRCESTYGENCSTCAKDCACAAGKVCKDGSCGQDCGNGQCDSGKGEDCSTCPKDCACKSGESCDSGQCQAQCGNSVCDSAKGENCNSCAKDCACNTNTHACKNGQCKPLCGDGSCDKAKGENCDTCAADCGCPAGKNCVNGSCGCVPQCSGKNCGDDGCGGSCGSCTGRTKCVSGKCECNHECQTGQATCVGSGSFERCEQDAEGCRYLKTQSCPSGKVCQSGSCCGAACQGKECGADGCGGTCGSCSSRASCQAGKCACQHECATVGASQCVGTGEYKECLKDASNCRYWSPKKACGSGRKCTNSRCCTPVCSGKECGTDGCGGSCGTCNYGCAPSNLCQRDVTFISIDIDCKQCKDSVFYRKPDTYIKLTLSTGASYRSGEKDDKCGVLTFNWKIPKADALALRNVKIEIWDEDVGSDDLCAAWSNVDLSKAGRRTLTKPSAKNAKITIEVKK